MNLIANAVAPLKQQAVDSAVLFATEQVERMLKKLELAGWDADTVNPPVRTGYGSRETYMRYQNIRNFISHITKSVTVGRSPRDPDMRVKDEVGIARYLEQTAKDAGLDFEAFVYKLNKKVGEVVSANLASDNVWYDSYLVVEKADQVKEIWNTQIITNYSKYGKAFNQFPTRLVKPKAKRK
jgi:hypothetical protein